METELKEIYECPTMEVVELKLDACIQQASIPNYIPEAW